MGIIKRQLGDRRLGFPLDFPLIDGDDVLVSKDRRTHHERRKTKTTLEEIEILLSQLFLKATSRS